MNLFDRVKLLIRSTVSGALGGSLFNLTDVASNERSDKLLDKAQARIEMLQQDLARAEQRGDTALADRLRREINDLQKALDKARRAAGRLVADSPTPSQVLVSSALSAAEVRADSRNRNTDDAQTDALPDHTRVADHIRQMRAQRSPEER